MLLSKSLRASRLRNNHLGQRLAANIGTAVYAILAAVAATKPNAERRQQTGQPNWAPMMRRRC